MIPHIIKNNNDNTRVIPFTGKIIFELFFAKKIFL